jgi:peptide-methionine (R)-S-oxide reductase
MDRRRFLIGALGLAAGAVLLPGLPGGLLRARKALADTVKKLVLSDAEWKKRLTPVQYRVLRHEDTEPAHSSPLNDEHREGTFVCAGCDLPLFTSDMKYDSGTGWPSFFTSIEGHTETKLDFGLIYPRTEYHCARCGGHQGHRFTDGPPPTGQRWCNNGVALRFIPKGEG